MIHVSATTLSGFVDIYRNGQHLSVPQQSRDLLPDVRVQRLVSRCQGQDEHGYAVHRSQTSLLYPTADWCHSGEILHRPNAGLLPHLDRVARASGLQVRIVPISRIADVPSPENVASLRYPDMAQFVRRVERGVIRYDQTMHPSEIIRELANAYPDLPEIDGRKRKIIVLGSNLKRLHDAARTLYEFIPGHNRYPVVDHRQIDSETIEGNSPVICSTFLGAESLEFAAGHLVILLDAADCMSEQAQLVLGQMDATFRLFGLLRKQKRLTGQLHDRLMSTFGPEYFDLMGFGQVHRPVSVAWVDHRQPQLSQSPSTPGFWSQCIHHSDRRNRGIARVAKLCRGEPLADGNSRSFEQVQNWIDEHPGTDRTVSVLVDRIDHAIPLARHLQSWCISVPDRSYSRNLPGSIRKRIRYRDSRSYVKARHQILASGSPENWHGQGTSVLIWAGSGPHGAPIPDSWLGTQRFGENPLLIVDFVDHHNPTLSQWSSSRRLQYGDHDFFPVGIDPAIGRLMRFERRVSE